MAPLAAAEGQLFTRRVLRVLLLAVLVVGVVFLLGWAYDVLLTIFAGAVLGVFLSGFARVLSSRIHLPYRGAVAVIVVFLLVLVTFGIVLVGPALAAQLNQLVVRVPAAFAQLSDRTRAWPLLHAMSQHTPQLGPVAGAAVDVVRISFEAVAGVFVALVIGIYGALDPDAYRNGLLRLVPPPRRERAAEVVERTTKSLWHWLVGQMISMVSVGAVTVVGLLLAGVPLAFSLGLLAGVMTYVPYLGVILSMVPALLVALSVGPMKMVWVLVVFAIAHGLEGYVLSPIIAKRTVQFPPAFTVAVQILFGAIWGVLGFAFATPFAIVGTIVIQMLYVEDVLGDRSESGLLPGRAAGAG